MPASKSAQQRLEQIERDNMKAAFARIVESIRVLEG